MINTCISVLNKSREGKLHTYSRKATECSYELYMCSLLVEVGVVLQQILFVDGHVLKSTKKKK